MTRAIGLVLLGALLGGPACSGESPNEPSPSARSVRCQTGFTPPAGFEQFRSFEDPYADHIGVRVGYKNDAGVELDVFSGIPGEFAEGMPLVAKVDVGTADPANLLGRGKSWVLVWEAEGPCAARAVFGDGSTRPGFMTLLQQAGIVPV